MAEHQTIHIAELADELGVSEMTIRRDMTRLERDGFLRRTYGGATAHLTRSMELLFNARALENAPAKRVIGMHAAQTLTAERTMFIGIGSTAEQFAMFLPSREELTVVTGSLPVASLLGTRKGRVIVSAGRCSPMSWRASDLSPRRRCAAITPTSRCSGRRDCPRGTGSRS